VQNEGTGKSSWWVINTEARTTRAPRRRAATMDPQAYEKRRHGRGSARRLGHAGSSEGFLGIVISPLAAGELTNPAAYLMSPPCDSTLELSPISFSLSPQDFRTRSSSNASSIGGRLSPIQAEPDSYSETNVSWLNSCRSGYQNASPCAAGYQVGHADSLAETLGKSLTGIFDSGSDYGNTPVVVQNGNAQSLPIGHGRVPVGSGTLTGYIPVPTSCYLLNQQQSVYRSGSMSSNAGGVYGVTSVNSLDYFNAPCGSQVNACTPAGGRIPSGKTDVPMICIGGNTSGAGQTVNDTMAGVQSYDPQLESHIRQQREKQQMQGQQLVGQQQVHVHPMQDSRGSTHGQKIHGMQQQLLQAQQEQGQQVPKTQQQQQLQWDLMNLMQQQTQQACQQSQPRPLGHPALDRQVLIRLLSEKPHLKEKIKQLLIEKSQQRVNNAQPQAGGPLRNTPGEAPLSYQSTVVLQQPGPESAMYPPPDWLPSCKEQMKTFPRNSEQTSTLMPSAVKGTGSNNSRLSGEGGAFAGANVLFPNDLDFDLPPSTDIECDINQIINYDNLCFGDSFDFTELTDDASASSGFDDFSDILK